MEIEGEVYKKGATKPGLQTLSDLMNLNTLSSLAQLEVHVNRIRYLIIAALVEAAKIEPDFRDVRIAMNSPRCVESMRKLVDLVV